ncbi:MULTISPECIES: hypothetical protein [unclassified Neisseria]|uniref:hypothetical protein n=1 Tax=unclassified Neisseria TaxID=2623750 RepID=UPI0010720D48|nr:MULTISPECIES: hypothetical protein [unclassified Neisseria]MBF0802890.1 hypothetical protein [Neisseria sp. 19428wB4_WF04]TFU44427.1 hypothetical protein E4T99_00655 [Neisseria sp. WF04]
MKVAFYKGTLPGWRGWFSRLVRFADRGPYSHCEVVFSDGLCASASWYDGGVRFKRIDFNPEHWDFVEVCSGLKHETSVRDWFARRRRERYDLRGSLGVVFRPVKGSPRRWFCSEAVACALGFPEPHRISPNLLAALLKG